MTQQQNMSGSAPVATPQGRTDVHRPSEIDPADYEYRWAFDTAGTVGRTAARFEQALKSSGTSVYRDPTRCDHCGAHLRYAVVYEHIPSGEHVCTGITCAQNTMTVPDRLTLRVERFRRLAKMRRERRQRKDEAVEKYPEVAVYLESARFTSDSDFVRSVARKYRRYGYLSHRQAVAVANVAGLATAEGYRPRTTREDRGRELFDGGRYRKVEDGLYEIEGSGGASYLTTTEPEHCPCPDHQKGYRCKHIICAQLAEDAESDAEAATEDTTAVPELPSTSGDALRPDALTAAGIERIAALRKERAEVSAVYDRLTVEVAAVEEGERQAARQRAVAWARSVLDDPTTVILDSETTGLQDPVDFVEVGVTDTAGNTLFHSLVRPLEAIGEQAEKTHGYSAEDLAGERTFPELFSDLENVLRGRRIVVYNSDYDGAVYDRAVQRYGLSSAVSGSSWECAMRAYAGYYGEIKFKKDDPNTPIQFRWKRLQGDHSATGDCRATLRLLCEMAGYPVPDEAQQGA